MTVQLCIALELFALLTTMSTKCIA